MAQTTAATDDLYYPCLKDWGTGEISSRVGEAMTWQDAVAFLKQNYPGAWQQATACPQRVNNEAK